MPTISEYNMKESFLRLLLQGAPGSGKTTLACGFPAAWIIDIDVNLGGPLRYRKNHNLPLPLGYDRVDSGAGTVFDRLDRALITAQANPEVQTIVIDSATGLADIMMQETLRKNPSCKDGRQIFGFFLQDGKRLIATLTQMKKHVVLTAHEKIEQDAMTQILQFRIAWPGQLGDYMGAFFNDVWRCEVSLEGFPPKPKFVVRTFQDAQHYGLKNDLELPLMFDFSWDEIQRRMNGGENNASKK